MRLTPDAMERAITAALERNYKREHYIIERDGDLIRIKTMPKLYDLDDPTAKLLGIITTRYPSITELTCTRQLDIVIESTPIFDLAELINSNIDPNSIRHMSDLNYLLKQLDEHDQHAARVMRSALTTVRVLSTKYNVESILKINPDLTLALEVIISRYTLKYKRDISDVIEFLSTIISSMERKLLDIQLISGGLMEDEIKDIIEK